ncbi:MAG: 50S ribosomal protein L9 [Myxococcota bacterium]|jgi:large subunit ribosomal protein L9|nr:50S ribosomal protein L9 [bacterium]MDP6075566.1 50S ribosomal protein L9 [Myxococcota bacterium]MDP6244296.1 50S ribosomal protein L9 [Myxococcota bacterium]MDP7076289.1 50S ribosomal protein L9 [Myxococcota bacterium]MDP7299129.1 50S ribosomal protein L9 [Myxococcota bacterium]
MAQVQLILQEAVSNLGEAGDLVHVRPGYARNYLIPQGKAIFATEGRVRELEHHRRVVSEKVAQQMVGLEAKKARIEALTLEIPARVGEEGKLFGSVTVLQIHERLAAQGFEIERRRIALGEPIKETGEHRVTVKLHRDVSAELKVTVTAEE